MFGRHTWIELALGFSYCELFGFYDAGKESGRGVALGQAVDSVSQIGECDSLLAGICKCGKLRRTSGLTAVCRSGYSQQ